MSPAYRLAAALLLPLALIASACGDSPKKTPLAGWVDGLCRAAAKLDRLLSGQAGVEPHVARQVSHVPACLERLPLAVEPEDARRACRRPDQVEQQPDRRRLAGAVRPEKPEDLPRLHPKVQSVQRRDCTESPRQPVRLDGRRSTHARQYRRRAAARLRRFGRHFASRNPKTRYQVVVKSVRPSHSTGAGSWQNVMSVGSSQR